MNRIELIKNIFKQTNFKNYLEIGCERGYSFLPLKARSKIAVDPKFNIPIKRKLRWIFKVPQNLNNKYFEEKSDDFFLKRSKFLKKKKFDVVLVDGMHTFRASLNDVMNSLNYLNEEGVIIMHDCLPPHSAAATEYRPNEEEQKSIKGWTGIWCGDVWKTIVYLRRNFEEIIDTCVIDTDFGLGIIIPKKQAKIKNLKINEKSFSEIDKLSYEELIIDISVLLNLKKVDYVNQIIANLTIPKNL